MVASVTHHTTDFIKWHMATAEGLGYQAIWLELQGTRTLAAAPRRSGLSIDSLIG